jgi:hypothetical protein
VLPKGKVLPKHLFLSAQDPEIHIHYYENRIQEILRISLARSWAGMRLFVNGKRICYRSKAVARHPFSPFAPLHTIHDAGSE